MKSSFRCHPFCVIQFLWLLTLLISSCSNTASSRQQTATSSSSNAPLERRLKSWDLSRRSSFETTAKTVKTDRTFNTKAFSASSYQGGKKFYSGRRQIQEPTFAQAGKRSRAEDARFSESDKRPYGAGDNYATETSPYQDRQSYANGRSSRYQGEVYDTRDEPLARRAMETSRRPYIKQLEEPGYTESEIKSLLHKD